MKIVDVLEAQVRLEELIDELAPGDWFEMAVDGEPRVKEIALTKE